MSFKKAFSFSSVMILVSTMAMFVAACVRNPSLEQPFAGPPPLQVWNIVNRAKCEFRDAIAHEIHDHPEVIWLADWETKIHLTLVIDDTSTFTPGATLTTPFHNAYNVIAGPSTLPNTAASLLTPSIASIPRNFTIGLGAGLSNEATRTEDLEFDLSVKAMEPFKSLETKVNKTNRIKVATELESFLSVPNRCGLEDNMLLDSDLGFREWLQAALAPVYGGLLESGPNAPPAGSAGQAMSPQEAALVQKLEGEARSARNAATIQRQIAFGDFRVAAKVSFDLNAVTGALLQQRPSDVADLEKKIDDLRRTFTPRKRQGTETYKTAELFYNGVITPLSAATTLTSKCTHIMQPELALGGLQFANVSAAYSKVQNFDQDSIDQLVEALNAYKKATTDSDKASALDRFNTKLKTATEESTKLTDSLLDEQKAGKMLENQAFDTIKAYKACRTADEPVALYDPLSVITHQVNFIVTLSGNVTPSWKLTRVTAPNSNSFASLNGKYTNTLIIGMGRSGPAVAQQILTSQLRSVLATP